MKKALTAKILSFLTVCSLFFIIFYSSFNSLNFNSSKSKSLYTQTYLDNSSVDSFLLNDKFLEEDEIDDFDDDDDTTYLAFVNYLYTSLNLKVTKSIDGSTSYSVRKFSLPTYLLYRQILI